jgi:hypothetical protein
MPMPCNLDRTLIVFCQIAMSLLLSKWQGVISMAQGNVLNQLVL